jgi:cell division septation protein DedD
VSDSTEGTHYQIELTSRQVLAGLVVILACLFAVFFAGISIGRDAGADQAALALASIDQTAPTGERFDFFSRTSTPSANVDERDRPAASTSGSPKTGGGRSPSVSAGAARLDPPSPLDDSAFGPDPGDEELSGADPDTLFADDPTDDGAGLAPPEDMKSGRRRRASATQREEAAPVSTPPTRTDTEPAAAAASGAATRPAATPGSGYFIQVLATTDRDKAAALVARLVDADFKALTVPSNEGGRTVYRVRVGPFADRALANRQAAELKSRWGLDSWISPPS